MKFSNINISRIGHDLTLVGGIWAGDEEGYLCFFPEFAETNGGMLYDVQMTPEDWKALLRQSDLVETEVMAQAEDGKLYKTVIRKCQRNISQNVSWEVYRRDGFRCRYCGNDQVPLTVDHLVLWEDGGPSIEGNLVAACRKCNKTRGNTPYVKWLKTWRYLKVSANLTPEVREANDALVETLDAIPRLVHKRKHR
jgi:hypothetical protein